MTTFVASYENMTRAEKLARAEGWPGEHESMLDYIDAHGDGRVQEQRRFADQDAAVAWIKAEIEADKSLFGAGDIRVYEPVKKRCQYCICRGWREVRKLLVTDDGIESDEESDDICHND